MTVTLKQTSYHEINYKLKYYIFRYFYVTWNSPSMLYLYNNKNLHDKNNSFDISRKVRNTRKL